MEDDVAAIIRGLKRQLREDGLLSAMGEGTICCEEEAAEEPDSDSLEEECWDDINGRRLNAEKVRDARKVELQYFKDKDVGELVPIAQCWRRTNRAPVTVRWIDHDKGTNGAELYRSRLVARQFRGDEESIFAATPPLEAKRMLLSEYATRRTQTDETHANG